MTQMAIARSLMIVALLLTAGCGSVVDLGGDGERLPLCAVLLNCKPPTPRPIYETRTVTISCGFAGRSVVAGSVRAAVDIRANK